MLALSLLLVAGCNNPLKDSAVPAPCPTRRAYYPDQDGDGWGASASPYIGCEAPTGYVEQAGDCDDRDPAHTADCGDSGDSAPDSAPDSGE